jgi:Arc/MetJ family transcription regulator
MKRTNLVLDEDLLEQAVRAFGTKTYSAAVNTALEEAIQFRKIRTIPRFFQSGIWEGDLAAMRGDRPAKPRRRRRST